MKVKYPNPDLNTKQIKPTKAKSHGMLFENALNLSNEYYRNQGVAAIYKKPTPIQVVRVDYPTRKKAKIIEGYYKTPSTTDYNGIYRGKYIDYEAKETNNLSFSFKHIFDHQITHLRKVNELGGIAFVIIYFKKVQEIYIIDIIDFYRLYEQGMAGGTKSITLDQANTVGLRVHLGYTPPIDYLKAVDIRYFNQKKSI